MHRGARTNCFRIGEEGTRTLSSCSRLRDDPLTIKSSTPTPSNYPQGAGVAYSETGVEPNQRPAAKKTCLQCSIGGPAIESPVPSTHGHRHACRARGASAQRGRPAPPPAGRARRARRRPSHSSGAAGSRRPARRQIFCRLASSSINRIIHSGCTSTPSVRPPGHQRAPGPLRRRLVGAGVHGAG